MNCLRFLARCLLSLATTLILVFFSDLQMAAAADDFVYIVTSPVAPVYSAPDLKRRTRTVLKRGRKFVVSGASENGFLPLATRTNAKAWVRSIDAAPESAIGANAETDGPVAAEDVESPPDKTTSRFGLEKLTFDLGGSFGSVGGATYTEVELGINAYFYKWLAWRNAVFGRFQSEMPNKFGLDTSVRGIFSLSGGVAGFTVFAGPGYRFVNQGGSVPFLEGGLILKLLGIAIGGGIRTLLGSAVRAGAPNDTQYFLILGGGGSL